MDLRKLKTLIDLVSESGISELEITEAEGKVRIVKAPAAMATPLATPAPVVVSALPAAAAGLPVPAPKTPETAASLPAAAPAEVPVPAGKVIKSPMVGTFYRSASPEAKPFVELGDAVKEGQPVCIIEAMKIMNEIEADVAGKITQILCENGQAVEFGQPLFIVE